MNVTVGNLAEALLWSALAGLGVWFVLFPLRRRSLSGLLVSLVLTGAAASMGAMLGAMHSMLVAESNWKTVVALVLFSATVVAIAAYAASRKVAMDADLLRQAIADLGEGRVPTTDGPRLSAEIERVRQELHATAAALAATREREHALESARRELVSWVSHDLRTPLAGLRAMSEALEDGVVDDPELYYKQIGASVDRLTTMVDDLFDLSRIQAGHVQRGVETVALDDLVSDTLGALTPLATSEGVRLVGGSASPATVRGNGHELGRAVTNLVANAIRHTREGGRVEVRVTPFPDRAEITVDDECGGIDPDHLERVFDVGFRGEQARTPSGRNSAGAGLGLAITRGIVEAHDGSVEVVNTDRGCRFRVRLPVG